MTFPQSLTTEHQKIIDTIQEILLQQMQYQETLPSDNFVLSEQFNSMQRMELAVAIEDHFEIIFEMEEEAAMNSFEDLILCIASKLSNDSLPTQ